MDAKTFFECVEAVVIFFVILIVGAYVVTWVTNMIACALAGG